ncbi:LysR family transcriptional regulator [Roseobacteraceae bacterium S113]
MDETHDRKLDASLDDLALFASVAQSGSLSAAARLRAMPLPTLSRRMRALEMSLARVLFQRGPSGYALTSDGRALLAELGDLQALEARVARWAQADTGPAPVRITAGLWTARHLARSLRPPETWRPIFVPSNAALDLARREADIGLRNVAPDHPWLARRRLAPVRFALYGVPNVQGIIAGPRGTPSQDWLHDTHADAITTTATDPRLCLDLAEAGYGKILLPTFVGDTTGLLAQSEAIPELDHDVWLTVHQDARHDPPIRAALDAIAAVFAT